MLPIRVVFTLLHLSTALSVPKHNAQHTLSSSKQHIHTDEHRPDIFVRFQKPLAGQTIIDARVTKLDWKSTLVSVTSALNDFSMVNREADMLWMDFTSRSLKFAGFLEPVYTGIVPQLGLSADDTALTFILPSGTLPSAGATSKISKIAPQYSRLESEIAKRCALATGMFGISGRLAATDYAYATGKDVREAIVDLERRRTMFSEAVMNSQAPLDQDTHDLRLTAVGSDGRRIVIHLKMR